MPHNHHFTCGHTITEPATIQAESYYAQSCPTCGSVPAEWLKQYGENPPPISELYKQAANEAATATEITRRESVLIKRRAAQERAKREGYAPKELTMTDISREFSSVFLDCIHPLSPDETTREGSTTT